MNLHERIQKAIESAEKDRAESAIAEEKDKVPFQDWSKNIFSSLIDIKFTLHGHKYKTTLQQYTDSFSLYIHQDKDIFFHEDTLMSTKRVSRHEWWVLKHIPKLDFDENHNEVIHNLQIVGIYSHEVPKISNLQKCAECTLIEWIKCQDR